ncbi:efflux RND transporter periplasmic adaptor subunit [Thalassotalea atypica]|uniref:efflux RND transporter periplasmic adaptor subunit n=1 Tax=Thalassotalea atypica TaxID=2054316 RepID=UPI00257257D3|nr:efflux RND transporter periplasmic adaptor subunit [Thalassotalea atypica]
MNLSHPYIHQRTKKAMLLLIVLTSAFTLSSCSKVSSETNAIPYYQAAEIIKIDKQQHFSIEREYVGRVVSKQQTNLSFEYAGRLKTVLVDSGEHVTKDQVLAEQDTELLSIKADELRAQVKQVEAQIRLNKANLKRINALIKDGYASEQNIDELHAEQGVLAASREGLLANLASLNYQISRGKLTAPYDGVLSERFIAEGDIVSSGVPAFKLIKQSHQEISVGIPFQVAKNINQGGALTVEINQLRLTAKVLSIGQEINTINRTVQVRLALEIIDARYNGQLARVFIDDEQSKSGYWVPISALTDGIRGQWNMYQTSLTPEGNYQVSAVIVDVLYSTQEHAFVDTAHSESMEIIGSGLHRYVPGQVVRKAETASVSEGTR